MKHKALIADAIFLFLFCAGVAMADGLPPEEWQKVEKGSAVAPDSPRFQPSINVAPAPIEPQAQAPAPIEPTLEAPKGRDLAAEEEKLQDLERQMLNKLGTSNTKLDTFDEE